MKWFNRRKKILLSLGILCILSAMFLFFPDDPPLREVRTFPVMGTVARLDFYGNSNALLEQAADEAQQEFRRLEAMCSIYDPESELSCLNRSAFQRPFHCSEDLWEILQYARKYYTLSDGAFDVTIKPARDRAPIDAQASSNLTLGKILFEIERFECFDLFFG